MATSYTHRDYTWGVSEGNAGALATAGSRVTPDWQDTSVSAGASTQIPVNGTIDIKKNARELRPNRANGYRQTYYIDVKNNNDSQAPTCNWNTEATVASFDVLLSGLFQRVVETSTASKFEKIFQWPTNASAWALTGAAYGYPDFSDDEGYFYAFIGEGPGTLSPTEGQAILSCVPMSATISCSSDANDGRLAFTSDWSGTLTQEYIPVGTPAVYASPVYWNFDDMTVQIGTTDVVCYGFGLTITPGFKFIPAPGNAADDIAMVSHSVRGYVDILWDATARSYLSNFDTDSAPAQLDIRWGSGNFPSDTLNDLHFRVAAKFLNHDFQGSEEIVVRLNFEGVKGASLEDIVVHLVNGLDRGWQSA